MSDDAAAPAAAGPTDLPSRIVVDDRGFYWRDYGDFYSMCPASEDNQPVVVAAVYVQSRITAVEEFAREVAALPAHPPAPPASTDDWTRLRAGVADAWAAVAERYGKPASAAEVGAAVEADATTDLNADSDRALHRLRYDRRALLNVIGVLLAAPPAPLPLDAAWAEAEAALPEGWALSLMPDIIEADRYDARPHRHVIRSSRTGPPLPIPDPLPPPRFSPRGCVSPPNDRNGSPKGSGPTIRERNDHGPPEEGAPGTCSSEFPSRSKRSKMGRYRARCKGSLTAQGAFRSIVNRKVQNVTDDLAAALSAAHASIVDNPNGDGDDWDIVFDWHRAENDPDKTLAAFRVILARLPSAQGDGAAAGQKVNG